MLWESRPSPAQPGGGAAPQSVNRGDRIRTCDLVLPDPRVITRSRQARAVAATAFVRPCFAADHQATLRDVASWDDLTARLDGLRDNANLFVAIRIRGVFETFDLEQVAGTLVGFWTPSYARTINVPGYHLHLLSDDHRHAGHVLELQSRELELELHRESHLQLLLPETPAFLRADLSGDPAAALAKAEGDHKA
jgi:acetolactate decarboxylase